MTTRFVAAGGVLATVLGCGGVGSPSRVLVVRSGEIDAAQDARVLGRVAEELQEFGFEVVLSPTVHAAGDDVGAARAEAAANDAASAVLLRFSHAVERPGVVAGTQQHSVQLETLVVSGDADHPVATERWEFSAEEYAPSAVERFVADAWADVVPPFALEHLLTTPPVATALTGQPSLEDMAVVTELRSREGLVARRSERATGYTTFCESERARLDGIAAAEGSTCPGDPCVQRTLLGVDPTGRAIVQEVARVPIFTVPPRESAYWWEPSERLVAVAADGAETPLLTANNLYGFGRVSPGADVGGVEWFGVGGVNAVVAFDLQGGGVRVASLLRQGEASSFSRASAAGVLVCLQEGGGCFTDAGQGRVAAPTFAWADWVRSGAGWAVAGALEDGKLAVHTPGGETRQGPALQRLRAVLGARQDVLELVVSGKGSGCERLRVDLGTLAITERAPMPQCFDDPAATPDGRVVGLGLHPDDPEGDGEVLVWDPVTGATTPLTSGGFPEEVVAVGSDGRVWFSRQLPSAPDEYDTRQYRRVVCSVPLPGTR